MYTKLETHRWYSNAIKKLLVPLAPENESWHQQDKQEGHGHAQAPLPPPKKLQSQPQPQQQLLLLHAPTPKAAKPKMEAPASPVRNHPIFGSPFANFDERCVHFLLSCTCSIHRGRALTFPCCQKHTGRSSPAAPLCPPAPPPWSPPRAPSSPNSSTSTSSKVIGPGWPRRR